MRDRVLNALMSSHPHFESFAPHLRNYFIKTPDIPTLTHFNNLRNSMRVKLRIITDSIFQTVCYCELIHNHHPGNPLFFSPLLFDLIIYKNRIRKSFPIIFLPHLKSKVYRSKTMAYTMKKLETSEGIYQSESGKSKF